MKMRFTSEVISLIIFAGINLTGWCESNPIINIPTESKTIGFTKKIVWIWGLPRKTIQDAYAEVDLDVTSLFRATCGVSLGDRERTQNERQAVYHGRQDSDLPSGGQWSSDLGCLSRT